MSGDEYAADFYCGLGGWADGFLAEGIKVIGFDVERHDYGTGGYPGQLVLQDVLSLHGSQFKDALCLVASPPCTEYSYMAMPWQRAKQIAGALREEVPFPKDYKGSRSIEQLNALFNACFRIQREASEAAGRHIPLIVENVKGAQPWVGRAQANFGSFYLWGDVGMVGNKVIVLNGPLRDAGLRPRSRAQKLPEGNCGPRMWADREVQRLCDATKSSGQDWSRFTKTGEVSPYLPGQQGTRNYSSNSVARKAVSAEIARIPFPLANYIAKQFRSAPPHSP